MMPFTNEFRKTEATWSCISPAMVNNGYLCIVDLLFKQFLFYFAFGIFFFIVYLYFLVFQKHVCNQHMILKKSYDLE